ncbi:conserved protein of unknown function [Bradyrhizobium vignae]|uniref:Uncharacterized protein n=2 Tax=Bradyrhizobium vignae TaxID=1549949 RepID=A0A2U3PTK0_9BRAD|nr:conserved protein of unknown function [Bradyrhizobium vignae]
MRSLAERSAQIIRANSGVSAAKGQRLNASIDTYQGPRAPCAERGGAALHLGIQAKARSGGAVPTAADIKEVYDHFCVGDAVPSLESIIEIFACTAHTAIEVHCPTCPRMSDGEHGILRAIAAAQRDRIDVAREQFERWLLPVGADWALAPVQGLATIFRMAGLILPDRHLRSFEHDRMMAMKSWLVGSPTLH